ncbi:PUA-like domain-containing protein [Auriculariales sp. MPI-PUGE-AT-0066]|nr:PUA-like domain-containing protein [Auriculariales sp. MPI-PUGE-AT-0066]
MFNLEAEREKNIQRNKDLLLQLDLGGGLDLPAPIRAAPVKPKPKPRKSVSGAAARTPAKRARQDDDDEDTPSAKVARVAEVPDGVRRSGRNTGRTVSYNDEKVLTTLDTSIVRQSRRSRADGDNEDADEMDLEMEGRAEHVGNRLGKRTHSPKTYGAIRGVSIGTWWETRAQCSTDAIHAPFVAGIAAGPQGAYSVALSGGYEDDVDLGDAFTYTGSGGRDLKGTAENRKNLRTAPQSSHQNWDNPFNRALQKSAETKKPIRVIRGYKLKSEWAPASGYRYDGLYQVEKAWIEPGLNKGRFKVCKFIFKRLPGQPALQTRSLDDDEVAVESEDESAEEVEDNTESVATRPESAAPTEDATSTQDAGESATSDIVDTEDGADTAASDAVEDAKTMSAPAADAPLVAAVA